MNLVYMMHSTTVPLDPRVREAMTPLLEEEPGSPEGLLVSGRRPARILARAREDVARMIGASPAGIIFTSSGTEACNLALKGVALARAARGAGGGRILVAATEHSAVLYPARTLGKLGFEIVVIPVAGDGLLDLDALAREMEPGALIVSVAPATTEIGTLQPLEEVARLAHARGALVHADACLAASAMPLDVNALGVDLLSLSAHKIGGPRGTGALWVRGGVRLLPLIEGGTHEGGRRGGSEYVAGIAGFGVAAGHLGREIKDEAARLSRLTARLAEGILALQGVSLNGHSSRRLPGMLNVSVEGIDGEALLLKLAVRGIAASSGSACFEETGKPSHVLLALGMAPEPSRGSVLFSLGRTTRESDVDRVLDVFPGAVASLRSIATGA